MRDLNLLIYFFLDEILNRLAKKIIFDTTFYKHCDQLFLVYVLQMTMWRILKD